MERIDYPRSVSIAVLVRVMCLIHSKQRPDAAITPQLECRGHRVTKESVKRVVTDVVFSIEGMNECLRTSKHLAAPS